MIFPALNKSLRGFTLIELLIVIAILGILAAAVLVAINPAQQQRKARDSTRKNDIGQIATAVVAYYGSNATYPPSTASLTTSGDLKILPNDPTGTNGSYGYTPSAGNTEAALWATLEAPTTAGGGTVVWCWRTAVGKATESAGGTSCTP